MARPLRINYSGAFYHVTSRGNERKNVFKSKRDREKFIEGRQGGQVLIFHSPLNYVKNEDATPLFCQVVTGIAWTLLSKLWREAAVLGFFVSTVVFVTWVCFDKRFKHNTDR
ncbi:MAG TPA: hypothetical protein ENH85_04520 [Candidatus Scalindua sp.]|nr:hypothetical protein [Candidatus Scalindua sp.]